MVAATSTQSHTSAGAAYVAAVAEPEEPDWTPPEDPEDPAANESDDEPDPTPPGAAGDEGEALTEGEAEAAQAEEAAAEPEAGEPKVPKPIDYSKKYLAYVAATPGQEFMLKVGGWVGAKSVRLARVYGVLQLAACVRPAARCVITHASGAPVVWRTAPEGCMA